MTTTTAVMIVYLTLFSHRNSVDWARRRTHISTRAVSQRHTTFQRELTVLQWRHFPLRCVLRTHDCKFFVWIDVKFSRNLCRISVIISHAKVVCYERTIHIPEVNLALCPISVIISHAKVVRYDRTNHISEVITFVLSFQIRRSPVRTAVWSV